MPVSIFQSKKGDSSHIQYGSFFTIGPPVAENRVPSSITLMLIKIAHTIPSWAALAISTMSVTFGVNLAKNGIFTAARTQRQMFRTNSASWIAKQRDWQIKWPYATHQPRSQGLSSLPPLVVETDTLVASGQVTIYPSKTAGWVGTQVHLVERTIK